MIEIRLFNCDDFEDSLYQELLYSVSKEIQKKLNGFVFIKDRKRSLLGKLMVRKYCIENNMPFDWTDWKIDAFGKPFLSNGLFFNISHSEKYVCVAFSNTCIGVDIEIVKPLKVDGLLHFFHQDEQDYMQSSQGKLDTFYTIWTRKEAYLKAKGVGLSESLNKVSCLSNCIVQEKVWFIHTLEVISGYKTAICTPLAFVNIQIVLNPNL